jgi:hypothetical protein
MLLTVIMESTARIVLLYKLLRWNHLREIIININILQLNSYNEINSFLCIFELKEILIFLSYPTSLFFCHMKSDTNIQCFKGIL